MDNQTVKEVLNKVDALLLQYGIKDGIICFKHADSRDWTMAPIGQGKGVVTKEVGVLLGAVDRVLRGFGGYLNVTLDKRK